MSLSSRKIITQDTGEALKLCEEYLSLQTTVSEAVAILKSYDEFQSHPGLNKLFGILKLFIKQGGKMLLEDFLAKKTRVSYSVLAISEEKSKIAPGEEEATGEVSLSIQLNGIPLTDTIAIQQAKEQEQKALESVKKNINFKHLEEQNYLAFLGELPKNARVESLLAEGNYSKKPEQKTFLQGCLPHETVGRSFHFMSRQVSPHTQKEIKKLQEKPVNPSPTTVEEKTPKSAHPRNPFWLKTGDGKLCRYTGSRLQFFPLPPTLSATQKPAIEAENGIVLEEQPTLVENLFRHELKNPLHASSSFKALMNALFTGFSSLRLTTRYSQAKKLATNHSELMLLNDAEKIMLDGFIAYGARYAILDLHPLGNYLKSEFNAAINANVKETPLPTTSLSLRS